MALRRLESREAAADWLKAQGARRLVGDSRAVEAGDAFVAWPGYGHDARRFVPDALAAGARACLVEAQGADAVATWPADDLRIAGVRGLKAAAGDIASRFLEVPSARLDVVAVTGTNGKTSTTWWVGQALSALGRPCGVIGTLGIGEAQVGAFVPTGLTTPDPLTLQAALHRFAERGFAACAIEASSIGIVEHRLAGTRVAVAVFTNFTQDHLDYHGDMAAYWQAKAQLFAWPDLRAAVVNVDDDRGAELAASLAAGPVDVWTVSARASARLCARDVVIGADGLAFDVVEGADTARLATTLLGDYNVANLLGVIGVLRGLGIGLADAVRVAATLAPVPGRMQRITAEGFDAASAPVVVVDYAHTPDALEKALSSLAPLATAHGGTLWCVFGCGGDRDAAKRPLMGAIACRFAGHVVVTSDNPRRENPAHILAQILAGAVGHDEVDVIEDRGEAIRHAVGSAGPGDIVVIAGKGHESTQDIGGAKLPFSDAAHAAAALQSRRVDAPKAADDGAMPNRVEGPVMATLTEMAALLPGARLVGDGSIAIRRVHSDTRSARPGDLFVALRGERFDAHDHLAQARDAGVAAVLGERGIAEAGLAGLQVADSHAALLALATAWRQRFALPLIAVTGSNGKTTVTQMIASILRAWQGEHAFATAGNFNNDIGLPLTLLRLGSASAADPRVGVVELGMNHPGEIGRLAAVAAPQVVLVNNAQREHLEFMESVAAVARENGTAIDAMDERGTAVFPADDAHAATWRALAAGRRVLTFAIAAIQAPGAPHAIEPTDALEATDAGHAPDADVTARAGWVGQRWQLAIDLPGAQVECSLGLAGRHNVHNALAAATCAFAVGCPPAAIGAGLAAFAAVKGRSQGRQLRLGGRTITLIDDTYNANPDSVRAAIDVLAALPAPRWLVLGDMGEVGEQGPAFHREVGAYAQERGIETVWLAGVLAEHAAGVVTGARWFADVPELVAMVGTGASPLAEAASVLVKGSRFMRMERVVAALVESTDRSRDAA